MPDVRYRPLADVRDCGFHTPIYQKVVAYSDALAVNASIHFDNDAALHIQVEGVDASNDQSLLMAA